MNSFTTQHDEVRFAATQCIFKHVQNGVTHVDNLGGIFPVRSTLAIEGTVVKISGMSAGIVNTAVLARAADILNGLTI